MIESPPLFTLKSLRKAFKLINEPETKSLLDPINDRYMYWSEIKYRNRPENISAEELWLLVRLSRDMLEIYRWPKYDIRVTVTNQMQRLCHEFDVNGSLKCSDFGNFRCSVFGSNTTVDSATMVQ